ncbi:MAG TPA: hypothetical protein PK200_14020 [Spirochaetota bacterium]|nr:hypothetical protein [Spirochaetota bacterium]HQP48545.1 hypothetical protein [Spirochaetota bacterium]
MKIKMIALVATAVFTLSTAAALLAQNNCPRGQRMNRSGCQQHLRMMDTNNDSKISRDEWNASHQKMFQTRDKNNDGYLTQEELNARQNMNRRGN